MLKQVIVSLCVAMFSGQAQDANVDQVLKIPSGVQNTLLVPQGRPLQEHAKFYNESLVLSIKDIDYQVSSKLYFKQGRLHPNLVQSPQQYSVSAGAGAGASAKSRTQKDQSMPCSLYPTSVENIEHQTIRLQKGSLNPKETFFYPTFGNFSHGAMRIGYLVSGNSLINKLHIHAIISHSANSSFESMKAGTTKQGSLQLLKMGSISSGQIQSQNSVYRYFIAGEWLFMVTSTQLFQIKFTDKKPELVLYPGFKPGPQIVQVQFIKQEPSNKTFQFLTLSEGKIKLFEIQINAKTVSKMGEITVEGDPFRSVLYDAHTSAYYMTSSSLFYIFSRLWPDVNLNSTLKAKFAMNDSCKIIEKVSTTIHLLCTAQQAKTQYIVELLLRNQDVRLNRFYTNKDVRGIRDSINIDNKMVLVGDEDFVLQNYGVNRKYLLDLGARQPRDVFTFQGGFKMLSIAPLNTKQAITLLAIYQDRFSLLTLVQDPPELSCDFGVEMVDNSSYSILMQFNISKSTRAMGSLELYETVSVPILITNKSRLLEKSESNLITASILLIAIISILIVVGCTIRINKCYEDRFQSIESQILKASQERKQLSDI